MRAAPQVQALISFLEHESQPMIVLDPDYNILAANTAYQRQFGTVDGQIITFFVMTVAAAEAAVGLALVIGLFRHRESLNPEAFTSLKW